MNDEARCGRSIGRAMIRNSGAPLLITAAVLLSSCGGGGFGCGDTGLGPCGPNPSPIELNWGVAVADFNHDGLPDVVVNHSSGGGNPGYDAVYLHASMPATGFGPPLQITDGTFWSTLTAVDIDGDGLPDLVSLNGWNYQVSVFLNDPQNPGTFGPPTVLDTQIANQVIVADLNGDGAPDLLVADNQVSLFLQNPAARGTFAPPIALYPAGAGSVAAGDLNGDGIADVAVADAQGVEVLIRTGTASELTFAAPVNVWTRSANATYGGSANQVKIVDLKGDGLNDLALTDPGTAGGTPMLVILLQDQAHPGQFLPAVTYTLPDDNYEFGTDDFVTADLNGDGYPDLVFGGLQTVAVYLQDPSHPGSFEAPTIYTVPNGATYVAVADIDGDGRPDIVLSGGATTHAVNGVITSPPGLMLQDASQPGHFKSVQDLQ